MVMANDDNPEIQEARAKILNENAVPGPFGPKDIPSTLVFVIVPDDVYAKMPAPQ